MAFKDHSITVTAYHRRDRFMVMRFCETNPQTHYHLDWESFQRWLYDPHNIIGLAWEGDHLCGVIAFSPPHQQTTWLRLISLPVRHRAATMHALWEFAQTQVIGRAKQVFVLVVQPWVEAVLRELGFSQVDTVINLVRHQQPYTDIAVEGVRLRGLRLGEHAKVLAVDHAAFLPVWQMRDHELREAGRRAMSYQLAISDSKVIGYQMSMHYGNAMHLARLATHPAYQGRGIGRLLVTDMLYYAERLKVQLVTVNTQLSNVTSQQLYYNLGFERTDQDLPVYAFNLGEEN